MRKARHKANGKLDRCSFGDEPECLKMSSRLHAVRNSEVRRSTCSILRARKRQKNLPKYNQKMISKVKPKLANWNPKGTQSEPNAELNASTNQWLSKNTFREVRDEGLGTILAPLGRFWLPFWRTLASAGVPKSASVPKNQNEIIQNGVQECVSEKLTFAMDF